MNKPSKLENLNKERNSSWGGVREGAGRKPRLQYEARELFYAAVDDEWENIMKVLNYQIRRGDRDTMKWVIEQRIGKAPQSVDLNTRGVVPMEPTSLKPRVDIMEIAGRVSKELKKIKTSNIHPESFK